MERPIVSIIEPQQEESRPADVSQSERDYLLAKYGYGTPQVDYNQHNSHNDLTSDQMWEMQEREIQQKRLIESQRRNAPRAVSFDNDRIGYSDSKYTDLDIDGQNFGIQVQIVSDMPINNNRRY